MGRAILIICASAVGLLLLGAARPPGAMPLASPGLWEFTGLPNAAPASRQCLANTATLARIEHRAQKCTESVISQTPTTMVIDYQCAGGGYGQTRVTMLTPRSLRIETQGISAGLPFNYKIQARRVGDCAAH